MRFIQTADGIYYTRQEHEDKKWNILIKIKEELLLGVPSPASHLVGKLYQENLFELDTSSFMSPPDFSGGSKYLGAEAATGESRGDRVVTK